MNGYTIQLLVPFASFLSFMMVFLSIPTILRVAHSKNLFDEPNKRSVHRMRIPTLGGLAIFIGFLFTYSLFVDWFKFIEIPFLIPALLIIFGIGIKDDILVTAPMVKLGGQLIAVIIVVGLGGLQITDFHGFFGLQPDLFWGTILTIVGMVFIINGFNLIDGIDGLAAITGIISMLSFSVWYFINEDYHIPTLAAALVGGLLAFAYYNIFSKRQKIFMGDTGSLVLGFLVAVVAVEFSEFNRPDEQYKLIHTMNSAPAVAMAILIVPIIDTLRVFMLRVSQGNSPFMADKNHIHHRMLALGFSHLQISLIIGAINIAFVILGFSLRNWGMLRLSILILSLGFAVAYIPSIALYYKRRHFIRRLRNMKKKK
ncbi:glycosyltransferase family 4 protein [Carboxylicivirga marina]|uniref:Undecaprenyl/decaprenyl-phosphate alpha-N-acetylglucosaminyl 1-phosphate transferase n=1 Tax=Carboxylicivirga marina TaxID=2800988 RepID=A0ABS1HNL8_9BACT|nr:MraY family glycosyltransferase [Carboxylicivirga marina]MBK3519191.1 undecaprenyl/decaprenyl-phosphate alpha-N-acetylglucosaminyl 1-phosphate transferase [Carboxylicivirga marina]